MDVAIVQAVTAIIMTIFTIIYSVITLFMMRAIKKQYDEMKLSRQLSSHPFLAIKSNEFTALAPRVSIRCGRGRDGNIDINLGLHFNVTIENIGTAPAMAVRGIAKLRLRDKDGKLEHVYKNWVQVDYISSGQSIEMSFHFTETDNLFARHIIELERIQAEAAGTFRYQDEIDNLDPDIDLFIHYQNLHGGIFLLQAEVLYCVPKEPFSPIFKDWLNMIETTNAACATDISLHNETSMEETANEAFTRVRSALQEKLTETPKPIELDTIVYECKVGLIEKKSHDLFKREWKSMTEEGILSESDLLIIDRDSSFSHFQ